MIRLSIIKFLTQSRERQAPVLDFIALLKKKRGLSNGTHGALQAAGARCRQKRIGPAPMGGGTAPSAKSEGMENDDGLSENLTDQGAILEKIEALSKSGKLGELQEELIRLLRENEDQQMRETAIEAVKTVQEPSAALVSEVLAILMRDDLCCHSRILAAKALGRMLKNDQKQGKPSFADGDRVIGQVLDGMSRLLMEYQPPILHRALRESVERIVNG